MFSKHKIELDSVLYISVNVFEKPNEMKTLKFIYTIHNPYLSLQP